MEAAISAIVGDLTNRVLSFLARKYTDKAGEDDKLQKLNQLLLRILAVIEEADGRYITNSAMLKQLEFLGESLYQGYHVLDTFKYKSLAERNTEETQVRHLSTLSIFSFRIKCSRTMDGTRRSASACDNLQSLLEKFEATVANMKEFVVLLMGCDRMYRRPYDTYLDTDNFMFGRHVEKQRIINFLLQPPDRGAALMVLPVIGGCRVGKKVLISHVCSDERVLSHFPSILHISGHNIQSMENTTFRNNVKTLVVIELAFDIDDEQWMKFYSSLTHLSGGSKMIIMGRLGKLARFGTVKPVYVNLSQAEYSYLFKMLAFGNTDQRAYPELVSVANELAVLLGGSLITANVVADLLRRNLDVQQWLQILRRFKGLVEKNFSMYGEHPKETLEKQHPIDISIIASACHVSLHLMPPQVEKQDESCERKLPDMTLGDLIAGSMSVPNEDFELVSWKSRIPPYTIYVQSVAACDDHKPRTGRTDHKRRRQ